MSIVIAHRQYEVAPTFRWDSRLKRRVQSGSCLRRRWPKVRGKAKVKRAKKARRLARELAA